MPSRPGYPIVVAQDMTPPPAGGVDDPWVYSDVEEQAMSLAADLRDRVQRERAAIANLQAYLLGNRVTGRRPE